MKSAFKKRLVIAVSMLSGLGATAWSPNTYACAAEPLVASVCVMAVNPGVRFQSMNQSYILAAGQTLSLNQYAALYSLLGITFGGDGRSTFILPDLRGKVIVGYDPRDATRSVGSVGGSTKINLTVAQLPQHAMTITNMPVTLNSIQATTTLSGLSATANLSGVVLKGAASGLTIKASSTSSGQGSPAGNYLGKGAGGQGFNYSNTTTPDAALNADSIAGDLTLTINQGISAPVSVTGNAATTVTGGGTASGVTNFVGAGADVPVMPPYLVLPYYIAYTGIYPSSGD